MMTTAEAASRLGVSQRRVTKLIESGDLVAQKFGNAWAVDEGSVERRLSAGPSSGRPKYGEKDRAMIQAYTLMLKNDEVLDFVYQRRSNSVLEITSVSNPELAPVGACSGFARPVPINLSSWISDRYIPKNRIGIRRLLRANGCADASELMFRTFGLNLTDQYWFKPAGAALDWGEINYFDNDYTGDRDASGPGSGTPGMLEKWWERRNGENHLVKSSSKEGREPYSELLATRLYERLLGEGDFVSYALEEAEGRPYSVCKSFIGKDQQLVTMRDLFTCYGHGQQVDPYDIRSYVRICEALGVGDVEEKLSKQIVCDFLDANIDRHDMNLGLIRDSGTMEYVGVAPIFDNGRSFYFAAQREGDFDGGLYFHESRPFSEYPIQQLALASDYSWFDEGALDGFSDVIIETLSANALLPGWFPEKAAEQFQVQLQMVRQTKRERSR